MLVEFTRDKIRDCVNCYKEIYPDENWEDDEIQYNLECVLNNKHCVGILAYEDGKCVGFAIGNVFYMERERYANLDEIGVIKEWQGKKIGTKLLEEFEYQCKVQGAYAICLEHFNFEKLNHFYASHGYFIPDDRIVRNKII